MSTVQAPGIDERLEQIEEQLRALVAEAEERRAIRESITELAQDLSPVANQGVQSLTQVLAEAENRGYGEFARSSFGIVDRVVTSFDEDDIAALGDNIVLILETVRQMTQPEVMLMLRSTLQNVQASGEPTQPPSLLSVLGQLREPEVRLGLARLVVFLRSLGSVEAPAGALRKEKKE